MKDTVKSVWLAWFQIATIRHFAPLLEKHGDAGYAADLDALLPLALAEAVNTQRLGRRLVYPGLR